MTSQPTIESRSKLELSDARVAVQSDIAAARLTAILERLDVYPAIAREVAEHLVDANLSGVESHGVMRILQYADQYRAGHLRPRAQPVFQTMETGAHEVDGQGALAFPPCAWPMMKVAGSPKQTACRQLPSAMSAIRAAMVFLPIKLLKRAF